MLQVIKYFLCLLGVLWLSKGDCQLITEEKAVEMASLNYPSIQIAEIRIKQQKAREKTAFNPEQPEFIIETPTDFGLGIEAEQKFDFPAVYSNRSKWLKSLTGVAEEEARLSKNEIIKEVRLAYLEAQAAKAEHDYYISQDSLWKEIAEKSRRLFDGGELNKAELLFAERQASMIKFRASMAGTDAINRMQILNSYTGGSDTQVEKLDPLVYTEQNNGEFYFSEYMAEKIRAAQNEMDVWKSERLPDLIIGYVKETEIDSDYPHRFKGGITVPIWQGQYKGEILASKAEIEMLQAETALRLKEASLERVTWKNRLDQAANTIEWFESTVIPQTDQLLDTYRRLYEGGQTDFTQTMKFIADSADAYREYVEILKIHNQAVIELDYLNKLN